MTRNGDVRRPDRRRGAGRAGRGADGAGCRPARRSTWTAVARPHPEHADELRRLLPAAAAAGRPVALGRRRRRSSGDERRPCPASWATSASSARWAAAAWASSTRPSRSRCGRRVALKVLPFAATLDPRQLQRFQNEAQAAASLHHEHIVPVYGVGCERGVHYYAMQFIDGQTLAAADRTACAAGATSRRRRPATRPATYRARRREPPHRRRSAAPSTRARRGRGTGRTSAQVAELVVAGGRGAGARPQPGHRPPGRQAGQPAAGRAGQAVGHRLRPGPVRRRRRPDDDRRPARHAALHEPGAGAGPARPGRPPHRRLLAWGRRCTSC